MRAPLSPSRPFLGASPASPGVRFTPALSVHLSVHHSIHPILLMSLCLFLSSALLPISLIPCFLCPSSQLHPIPPSIPSLTPPLTSSLALCSSSPRDPATTSQSVPLSDTTPHHPLSHSISTHSLPCTLLTAWSASLLARERLGVMRPRREPTGLGSWLLSAAPEGVMSLRAITSPTSLGLLRGKKGKGPLYL